MLKQIGIENFKAFADLQEINLAPITLIYGANSSGKSSIIHSLMVLKQSMLFPNLTGGIYSDKRVLDVGNYITMVYSHNLNKDIVFNLKFDSGFSSSFNYSYIDGESAKKKNSDTYNFSYLKKAIFFDNNFGYSLINKFDGYDTNLVKSFKLNILNGYKIPDIQCDDNDILLKCINSLAFNADEELQIPKNSSIDHEAHYELWRELKKNNNNPEVLFDTQYYLGNCLMENANFLKKELSNVSYLGPLRSNPKRYYSVDTDFEVSVGKEGENIAYFLKSNKYHLTKSINSWFLRFDIPYEFKPKSIGEKNFEPLIQIELKDLRNNVAVSPLDVGFGIGQILPILVEGIIRKESIICVEQPEIHLHPKLQAELAEFFAETCTNNQWIIETHSEALMLRIQKLIRNKKVINGKQFKSEDVSILYVLPSNKENDFEGAEVVQIRLDDDGDFMDYWPEGFFEERIKERR